MRIIIRSGLIHNRLISTVRAKPLANVRERPVYTMLVASLILLLSNSDRFHALDPEWIGRALEAEMSTGRDGILRFCIRSLNGHSVAQESRSFGRTHF
jgi:hypothetical protein